MLFLHSVICIEPVLQCSCHRVICRVLQNDHLVLFTQPETHGTTTDLEFYSLKDAQTHDMLNYEDHIWPVVCQREEGGRGPADAPPPTPPPGLHNQQT